MPVTFPAHQGLIAGVKLKWPKAIDGTAVCIGAAAPDLAYSMGTWMNGISHHLTGVLVWAFPFTLVATMVTRWRAASGVFAAVPDAGPLRLLSYGVLGERRPSFLVTATSALIGIGSHIFIDGFTHRTRWGANFAGLNGTVGTAPILGDMSAARVLQYLGHGFGSIAFVVILLIISSSGRLEQWYGHDAVQRARSRRFDRRTQIRFWVVAVTPVVLVAIAAVALGRSPLFPSVTVSAFSMLVTGAAFGSPVSVEGDQLPGVTSPVS